MNKRYDIIVIGGGHNGLTAAAFLAKKGKKVLVIEKRDQLGGTAAGEEFHRGYRTFGLFNDTSWVRRSVIDALKLEDHGLKTTKKRPETAILSKNGGGVLLSGDIDQCISEISKFSKADAEGYRDYRRFIDKISGLIVGIMNEVPPDFMNIGSGDIWQLLKKGWALKRLGKKTMMELLKVAPMSVADFLNERFETDFLKAGMAGPAVYSSFNGPWSSYTTLNLLLWECLAKENVVGGPHALITALEKAVMDKGVDIQTGIAVDHIILNEDRVVTGVQLTDGSEINANVVASSCTPSETFFNLFKPNEIEYSLEQGIRHYRSRGTTAKINLAMSKPLEFNLNTQKPMEFARTGNTFDEMEKAFDPAKYRKFSDEPLLDIAIPTVSNPDLAPEGHSVVSILIHFAPHHFDGGWTMEQKEKLKMNVFKTLRQYTKDFEEHIVGEEVLSPVDIEERYTLTNGHLLHGEHAVDQLITRPIPSCSQYRTPIRGLYLCGSGSHPGGGITCAPGALSAKTILREM